MAPIKFEDNIKEKIEQRVLQPSQDAWSKLSDRLDQEPKKKRFGYWWLGMAASIIGIAIVSLVMFNTTPETQNTLPVLVEEDVKPYNKALDTNKTETVVQQEIEELPIENQKIVKKTPVTNIKTNVVHIKNKQHLANDVMANVSSEKEEVLSQKQPVEDITSVVAKNAVEIDQSINKNSFEDNKVQEVVAQIQQLQKMQSQITEGELDALLKQAQKDIMRERIYNASTRTVDAEALLLDVESDIENSFRDRVFEALKSGYEEVKTAIVERNN